MFKALKRPDIKTNKLFGLDVSYFGFTCVFAEYEPIEIALTFCFIVQSDRIIIIYIYFSSILFL